VELLVVLLAGVLAALPEWLWALQLAFLPWSDLSATGFWTAFDRLALLPALALVLASDSLRLDDQFLRLDLAQVLAT
jgi:hypothetical protein